MSSSTAQKIFWNKIPIIKPNFRYFCHFFKNCALLEGSIFFKNIEVESRYFEKRFFNQFKRTKKIEIFKKIFKKISKNFQKNFKKISKKFQKNFKKISKKGVGFGFRV